MLSHPSHDIQSAADIDRLVALFYQAVMIDPIIGFFFTDISPIDLRSHLPKISRFWQLQLLSSPGYQGRIFEKHLQLHQRAQLNEDHFHRWLYLFENAIDQLFKGVIADLAKTKARAIAKSMLNGLHSSKNASIFIGREQQGLQFFDPSK